MKVDRQHTLVNSWVLCHSQTFTSWHSVWMWCVVQSAANVELVEVVSRGQNVLSPAMRRTVCGILNSLQPIEITMRKTSEIAEIYWAIYTWVFSMSTKVAVGITFNLVFIIIWFAELPKSLGGSCNTFYAICQEFALDDHVGPAWGWSVGMSVIIWFLAFSVVFKF